MTEGGKLKRTIAFTTSALIDISEPEPTTHIQVITIYCNKDALKKAKSQIAAAI